MTAMMMMSDDYNDDGDDSHWLARLKRTLKVRSRL